MVPITKIETLGYLEIAKRVKQYATALLRYAVQQKIIRFNPAYDLEGAVQKLQREHNMVLGYTLLERRFINSIATTQVTEYPQ